MCISEIFQGRPTKITKVGIFVQLKNSFVGARRAADRARAREKVVKTLLQFIAGVISLLFMAAIAQSLLHLQFFFQGKQDGYSLPTCSQMHFSMH